VSLVQKAFSFEQVTQWSL